MQTAIIATGNATNCSGSSYSGSGLRCGGSTAPGNATNCKGTSVTGVGLYSYGNATNCVGISTGGTGLNCEGTASFCRGEKIGVAGVAIIAANAIGCTVENGTVTAPQKHLGTP